MIVNMIEQDCKDLHLSVIKHWAAPKQLGYDQMKVTMQMQLHCGSLLWLAHC